MPTLAGILIILLVAGVTFVYFYLLAVLANWLIYRRK